MEGPFRSSYGSLIIGGLRDHFPRKINWKLVVPTMLVFFVWTATLDSIITDDNLIKKKCFRMSSRCCICCKAEETKDRLLLRNYCSMAKELQDYYFPTLGNAQDLMECWGYGCRWKSKKKA